jgi:hypothetical protein
MRERDIEGTVCTYAESHDCLTYKFTSPARRNVPDRIIITPSGVVYMIEFKAPGKGATEAQIREHKRLKRNYVPVFVVDDIEEGKDVVRRML